MRINAENLDYRSLNMRIGESAGDVLVDNCHGLRYIGVGLGNKRMIVNGTPGNALGAYLDGAEIIVNGNAQDAVGSTMNDGKIIIDGNAGDALGYAMRGGKIFVRGNAGYRTGIHMKQYKDKRPVIVVGGSVGSFLGEYLAGGLIVVLGLDSSGVPVGNFTGTGMHGGSIFIRWDGQLQNLPAQVEVGIANDNDMDDLKPVLVEYADSFNMNTDIFLNDKFYKLSPNTKNPYKQLYVAH